MQQKKMLIIAGAIILILLIGGGIFFALSQKHSTTNSNVPDQSQQVALPTLAPGEIGMSLAVSRGGKSVTMTANKLDGITSMDYEVTYTANNSGNDVPRGVIGHIDVNGASINQEVVLGTCSDVCHYDTVVSPVKFAVKVTKSDGKIYEVDQSISL